MLCPNCGKDNPQDAPFCSECGKSLASDTSVDALSEFGQAAETPVISEETDTTGSIADAKPAADPVVSQPVVAESAVIATAVTEPAHVTAEIPAQTPVPTDSTSSATYAPTAQATAHNDQSIPNAQPAQNQATDQGTIPNNTPADTSVPVGSEIPTNVGAPAGVGANTAGYSYNSYNDEPWRAYQQQPPQPPVTYAKGCLSAAWSDMTNSPSWFSRIILLGLINLVPILNFVTFGYAMRWSRQLMLDRVEPMPKQIFVPRAFVNGFFAVVISLVISIIFSICSAIIGFVPVLGGIVALALSFFVAMFEYVAIMRAAVADRLGAAFDVSQVWNAFKRNMGELFCAACLPNLIVGIAAGILITIFLVICSLVSFGSIASIANMSYGETAQAMMVMQLIISMFPAFLVLFFILGVFEAFAIVLVMRAVGHYVARYAQDWKGEAAVMSTAYINGD